jgi:hypothetical protein
MRFVFLSIFSSLLLIVSKKVLPRLLHNSTKHLGITQRPQPNHFTQSLIVWLRSVDDSRIKRGIHLITIFFYLIHLHSNLILSLAVKFLPFLFRFQFKSFPN